MTVPLITDIYRFGPGYMLHCKNLSDDLKRTTKVPATARRRTYGRPATIGQRLRPPAVGLRETKFNIPLSRRRQWTELLQTLFERSLSADSAQ